MSKNIIADGWHKLTNADWLCHIATHNFYGLLFKELLGSFVPHEIFCTSNHERMDELVEQVLSDGGSYGAGLAYNRLMVGVLEKLNPALIKPLSQLNKNNPIAPVDKEQQAVYDLGIGLASCVLMTGTGLAASYLRNYVMSRLYKTQSFVDLTGLNGQCLPKETPQQHQKRLKQENNQLLKAGQFLGGALLASTSIATVTYQAVKKQWALPQWVKHPIPALGMNQKTSLLEQLRFKNGDFLNLPDLGILAFSAVPIYIGLIASARDAVEAKEDWLRFGFYTIAMIVAPRLVESKIEQCLTQQSFTPVQQKTIPFLAQVATGVGVYSLPPILSNLALRERRAKQAGLLRSSFYGLPSQSNSTPQRGYGSVSQRGLAV
jgi:hypothetical protein